MGSARSRWRSASEKPPSGPTRTASGPRGSDDSVAMGLADAGFSAWSHAFAMNRFPLHRSMLHGLIREDQPPRLIPARQHLLQTRRRQHLRHPQHTALLGGLDRIRAHAVLVDPLDLRALGQHWPQPPDAELGRLLHHVVETGTLQRRKEVVHVGAGFLRAELAAHPQCASTLAGLGDCGGMLALAPIEHRNLVA